MKIYLAGFVPKGDKEAEGFTDWRAKFVSHLSQHIDAEFIDPRDRDNENFDESDALSVFGLDCKRIKGSDIMIVNGDQLGVGGSQEILIAKYFQKPVIVVLPKNTIHRRTNIVFDGKKISDWAHPFIKCPCDLMVDNIRYLDAKTLTTVLQNKPKGLEFIDEAIEYAASYLES